MSRMLNRIPDTIDKREGSLIWTAVGPVCAELAQAYIELDSALNLAFLNTSCGPYLDQLANQAGEHRIPASFAICRGEFSDTSGAPASIPDKMRFSADGICFQRAGLMEPGIYRLICETPGKAGNISSCSLLPVDYLENLGQAKITALLNPGSEAESDDALRERLLRQAGAPAFGGNIADYREKILALGLASAAKITPVPDGPGTVRVTVLGNDFLPVTPETIAKIQAAADPQNGNGKGFAPIGHRVSVYSAEKKDIAVSASLTLKPGISPAQVTDTVRTALENYFLQLRREWADSSGTVVRINRILLELLSVEQILDASITLNGGKVNIELPENQVPVLGTLTLS